MTETKATPNLSATTESEATPEVQAKNKTQNLRVAVVHDWLFVRRGGEKVLEEILDLFPQADFHYLFGNPNTALRNIEKHRLVPSFLASIPGISKFYKMFLPLLPVAAEAWNLQKYDLIISSSSCVAKGIIPNPLAAHVSYIHSPMRYAWDQEHRYFPEPVTLLNPVELVRRILLSNLRRWDVTSAMRIDKLVANSAFVARRCKLYYGRQAQVVYPPVEWEHFQNSPRKPDAGGKVLLFGAWVPYKRMRWALEILLANNIPVIAAGSGEDFNAAKLAHGANNLAEFYERPSDEKVTELYSRSQILLFPAIEDFGIVPLEAIAAGVPVVAPNVGGTAETVSHGITGIHFNEGDPNSMLNAVLEARKQWQSGVDRAIFCKHAALFSRDTFRNNFSKIILEALAERTPS